MAQLTREEVINALAEWCLQGNLETWRCRQHDEDEKLPAEEFATYGIDPETVAMILRDLNHEVAERLTVLQRAVARELDR